ncbi:MAG: N-acetylmuramoyl-L-alanine amidase [Myxococcaceae bacterium]|nr:N-acetylmuramoyl-L-alanine amidase [Myxococcaceae bacterium]
MLSPLAVALTAFPDPASALTMLEVPPPPRGVRIVVDAGHGAPGNTGNHGCFCQAEADETRVEAMELARRLRRQGFEVLETRTEAEGAKYRSRIAAIEAFAPHVVISLHTDARADAVPARLGPDGTVCWENRDDPGFSVLWSDEGGPRIVERRTAWGRALSRRLREAGFTAYSGEDYGSLYRTDDEPACFVDARPLQQRVYFLRATTVAPVVIVETHHALDPLEVARWHDADTHDAFAAAVAKAVLDVVQVSRPPAARRSRAAATSTAP